MLDGLGFEPKLYTSVKIHEDVFIFVEIHITPMGIFLINRMLVEILFNENLADI